MGENISLLCLYSFSIFLIDGDTLDCEELHSLFYNNIAVCFKYLTLFYFSYLKYVGMCTIGFSPACSCFFILSVCAEQLFQKVDHDNYFRYLCLVKYNTIIDVWYIYVKSNYLKM